MANVSPRKTPRREKPPSRYLPYNAEPENVGTRTGRAMPVGVSLLENGLEDPNQFLGTSSPQAATEFDYESTRTATTRAGLVSGRSVNRATVRSEITSRSVVNGSVNGHGRRSLAGLADGDDQDDDEEDMGGLAVDSLLDDTLPNKGKGKETHNGSGNQSLEDMDISTLTDTPTKRRGAPNRPRPSASPATGSSRPILSQLADRGLDDIALQGDGLHGEDSGNAFDDDDEGDVAESPSVRAAKAGDAKRNNASSRRFTALSKRLGKSNGATSLRALGDAMAVKAAVSKGSDAAGSKAGPSRRTDISVRDTERPDSVAGEAEDDDEEPIAANDHANGDDQALGNDDDDGVDPAFGAEGFDEDLAPGQAELDADPERISSRRSSTRAAAAKSREKTAATAKGKGKKSRLSPKEHSVDEFDDMPEEEAAPAKAKPAAKKAKAPSKPVAKVKKTAKAREAPTITRGTSSEPRPRGRSTVQLAAEHVERVDEAARTRGRLRSAAERHAPLRYWIGEKPLLKRNVITDEGDANDVVPELQGWLTKEQTVQTLGQKKSGVKRKRGGSNSVPPRATNKRRAADDDDEEDYKGWDDETEASCIAVKWSASGSTDEEELRRVACTTAMVRVKAIKNANFGYQKIFGEDEFFAAGVLHIPFGAEKAAKNSRDNAYAFHVFKGAVKVTLHRYQFVVAQGGQFFIPRGNSYAIENVGKKTAEIFFSQARRLKQSEMDAADQKDADNQSDDGQGMDQDDGSASEDAN